PICGSFLQSVYTDKKLGYNSEAKFIKPMVDKSDIIYDYFENVSGPPSPEAEGSDMGNGGVDAYTDQLIMDIDTSDLKQIKPESEIPAPPKTQPDKPKADTGKNQTPAAKKPEEDSKGTNPPKAVMPPPVKKDGQ
ncbi:MAG TPA: hypothetical protein PKD90_02640, partial [Phnomibacter sp.]|nr:hypothetical protein [Phnomibacter sp.]